MDRTSSEVQVWLTRQGLAGASERDLLYGLSERLVAAGVPLDRSFLGVDVLHPTIGGRVAEWRSLDHQVLESDYGRVDLDEAEGWLNSALYVLDQSPERLLHWRLDEIEPGQFPLLDRIRSEGGRDYVMVQTDFADPDPVETVEEMFTSWASNSAFEDRHLQLIEAVLPALGLAVKVAVLTRIARGLLETYLGRDAATRVLRGEIERGRTRKLQAILWFSDLRGFTKIADQSGPDHLVPLLNDYSDCLVQAIHGHGGQVLKFMGDGVLATFELDHDGTACVQALDAAEAAGVAVEALNQRRRHDGLPVTGFDLALHLGEVLYGNIGSQDRLDFTVVGPAVNEASRIEAMCDALDQRVVISEAFHDHALACRERLVSLGRYMLRGVSRPQELFTLDPGWKSAP